jgi:hypothetical protein
MGITGKTSQSFAFDGAFILPTLTNNGENCVARSTVSQPKTLEAKDNFKDLSNGLFASSSILTSTSI